MCGINGFTWCDEKKIREMNVRTKNRGPDDEGVFTDHFLSLGHNRLSIIDLSPKGHQPMSNSDNSIWITYNGEIFNYIEIRKELEKNGHKFLTESDTEVIIHAYEEYGFDCLKKFNGMWAFCIYDKNKEQLFLSRDQFGIKPLYYFIKENNLIFSSMISGILCHDIETTPNDEVIMRFLAYNLEDNDNLTFFNNVFKLNPNSYMVFSLKNRKIKMSKWYSLNYRKDVDLTTIRKEFINSINLRTRSDVPIGSCLSGGIDSSAIVMVLNSLLHQKFDTFSLVAPNNKKIDESKYIKEIGKHSDIQQYFTTISINELLNEILVFIRAQEEPVTGLSPYAQFQVMKLARQHGAKVLLDGQGGDELFAGYEYYFSYYFYELLRSLKLYSLLKEMYLYHRNFKTFYPHSMLLFILLPDNVKTFIWRTFINKWINFNFLQKICKKMQDPRWNPMKVDDSLKMTFFSTAIPHLLRWEDKNSMHWSIESRPPFIDVNLVESAFSVPSSKKIQDGKTKVIFKESIDDYLPELIKRRTDKIGFETPVNEFFRNENSIEFCRKIINSDRFERRPYWNIKIIKKMYAQHLDGSIDIGDTIWKWINVELWIREYFPEN